MSAGQKASTRRDFLKAAGGMTALALALLAWPFISAVLARLRGGKA